MVRSLGELNGIIRLPAEIRNHVYNKGMGSTGLMAHRFGRGPGIKFQLRKV
jgi:hypothetical protein